MPRARLRWILTLWVACAHEPWCEASEADPRHPKPGRRPMLSTKQTSLGLTEQELRDSLIEEFTLAFRMEQNTATIHAIAHSVAPVLELDHLRPAEQLDHAGVTLAESEPGVVASTWMRDGCRGRRDRSCRTA